MRLENVGTEGSAISVNMEELFPGKQIGSIEARSLGKLIKISILLSDFV